MKENRKQYWKGIEQLANDPEFVKYANKEFPEYLPVNSEQKKQEGGSSRRDFLKMMGFSLAAASLASCEAPVRKAIPYLNKPVNVDPGVANYFASTYMSGGNYCSIVVKTREGRPIKIEGNKLSRISGGGTDAQVEASVLSLYDTERLTEPYINGSKATWDEIDEQIKTKLAAIASKNGKIRIISKTILSPTTHKALEDFKAKYPGTEVVVYDPISAYGINKANELCFGNRFVPNYKFNEAKVIVSFGADFLGTWINPVKFSADFAKTRKLSSEKQDMSRLYAFESNLSLTGANADYRMPIRASQQGLIVANLYNELLRKAGLTTFNVSKVEGSDVYIKKAASDLWRAKSKSLVVSGSNDPHVQIVVNAINDLLGAYKSTIDINKPVHFRQGDDVQMENFINQLSAGQIDGVIFLNANPVYDHPRGKEIEAALGKVNLKVSTSERKDETAGLVDYLAPDNHFLESWNDAEPVKGSFSLTQPAIRNLFNTRQAPESILAWSGNDISYLDYLQANWKASHFSNQNESVDFTRFWDKCLHDGVYDAKVEQEETESTVTFNADLNTSVSNILKTYQASSTEMELVMYEKVAIGDGTHANNPWLQEMSDPISKACWDNYLTVSQSWAEEHGIKVVESRTVTAKLNIDGQTFTLPVMVQPGQAKGTFGLALGYGRTQAGKVGNNIGVNAYPLLKKTNGAYGNARVTGVEIVPTSDVYHIAHTQTHHTFMGRSNVIQESDLPSYQKDPYAGRHRPHIATSDYLAKKLGEEPGHVSPQVISLWKGHEYNNHHWAMAIDLNSCTGCSACTIACQAENNVPVVGKQEVINRREMHWIRIDRYYSSNADDDDMKGLEQAAENPEVTFMPMLCQQCNNAPCETVCPVAATTHSSEGLNQMTYNRCIGTRYCANNCPYKVRRFNWFKYHDNEQFDKNSSMNNDLGKMVLNPDVTVRSRGVMEKCTFCVQRIQAGKLQAKMDKRRVEDEDINPACAAACTSGAIVFGDIKNPESKVSKLLKFQDKGKQQEVHEPRAYHVLEEINVKPNIWYFTKIRNKDEEIA